MGREVHRHREAYRPGDRYADGVPERERVQGHLDGQRQGQREEVPEQHVATVAVAVPRRVGLVPLFALAAGGALLLAVRAPLATTVLGLIGFGVLHNVL